MKQNLKSYLELIASLEQRFDDLQHAYGQRTTLQEESEKHRSQRDKVLAEAVAETDEENIDRLAKHSARVEVYAAKLKHLEGQIEQAEDELQRCLVVDTLPPFRNYLYSALMRHRFERGKTQIVKLVAEERRDIVMGFIDQLSQFTEAYVEGQKLAIHVSDGASSPLHDTPGVPWSQYRQDTFRIVLTAAQSTIAAAKRLLAVVETEKGFEIPSPGPAPVAAVEVNEPELVEA